MDFAVYLTPVYAIMVLSAIVAFIPEWRFMGLLIFFVSAANVIWSPEIEALLANPEGLEHDGLFWAIYDSIIMLILLGHGIKNDISYRMGLLLAVAVGFHLALEWSVLFGTYSFFWREYANIIFTLNTLQILFLLWGAGYGLKLFLDVCRRFVGGYSRAPAGGHYRSEPRSTFVGARYHANKETLP